MSPEIQPSPDIDVRVHDASHFEWAITLPLSSKGLRYEIETEFELPFGFVSSASPWERLRAFTRLTGAAPFVDTQNVTVDALRAGVLNIAQTLQSARTGFTRRCLSADLPGSLDAWLEASLITIVQSRTRLIMPSDSDPSQLTKERSLSDEFISVKLLTFLADAREILETSGNAELREVDRRLESTLEEEVRYRRSKGYPLADPEIPLTLEAYVERMGRLKKHFQDVLEFERNTYLLDERVSWWVTSFAALVAGALAFALQLALSKQQSSWSAQWGSGVILFSLIAGISYAAKDRFKEISRAWLTGKVYRFYAQRVVRCRAPNSLQRVQPLVVSAREWCNETTSTRPDPLNPESGASLQVTLVHHIHKGHILPDAALAVEGIHQMKHVFRYDLAVFFPRLRSPLKRIPVFNSVTGRSSFVDAPRRYQIPIHIGLKVEGHARQLAAQIILDRQGLRRVDPVQKMDAQKLNRVPDR